ncbi:MAG: hypothetical protein RLZZ129_1724, partial [Verrucomicrobiota bacterium]
VGIGHDLEGLFDVIVTHIGNWQM